MIGAKKLDSPLTLFVEGSIGAGKSTFLKMIKQDLPVSIVYEPHEKWQNVGGENLLEAFYADTARWAYTFQSYAFITRIAAQEEALEQDLSATYVLERSVFSDRYCFAKNCYESGLMSDLEWNFYRQWFSWLSGAKNRIPSAFIYLRTDPDICYKRLLKRNRHEEAMVSIDYLQDIHRQHEQWLIEKQGIDGSLAAVPVLIIDGNGDFESDAAEWKKQKEKIREFCQTILYRPLDYTLPEKNY